MKKLLVVFLSVLILVLVGCSPERENNIDLPNGDNHLENEEKELYEVTFVVEVPLETPENADIYIYGEFNGWVAGDSNFRFSKQEDGRYELTFEKPKGTTINFKFNRGSSNSEEASFFGDRLRNRNYTFEFDTDRVFYTIEGWLDL